MANAEWRNRGSIFLYSLLPSAYSLSFGFDSHLLDAALEDRDHSPADCFDEAGHLAKTLGFVYDVNRCKVGAYEFVRREPHVTDFGAETLERGLESIGGVAHIGGANLDVVGNKFRAKHLSL